MSDAVYVPVPDYEQALRLMGVDPATVDRVLTVSVEAGRIQVTRYRLDEHGQPTVPTAAGEVLTDQVDIAIGRRWVDGRG